MQNHPDAKGLYGVQFPYYDLLTAIYGKDIATGEGVEDMSDAFQQHGARVSCWSWKWQ
jgi:hypothetical protein